MSIYSAMTLGDLITALDKQDDRLPIVLDDGRRIACFGSWRGVYAELAMEPAAADESALGTVGEVLAAARAAVGATFEGYKGGDFTMDAGTDLWVSPWGQSDHVRPIGARVVELDGAPTLEIVTCDGMGVW